MACNIAAVNKTLVYAASAARSFWKLPDDVQEAILRALLAYGRTGEGDVKRLKGGVGLRLRVGVFRVIFEESKDGITILAVGDRRDIYR
jgi:mRNA interferase RelE/StbE